MKVKFSRGARSFGEIEVVDLFNPDLLKKLEYAVKAICLVISLLCLVLAVKAIFENSISAYLGGGYATELSTDGNSVSSERVASIDILTKRNIFGEIKQRRLKSAREEKKIAPPRKPHQLRLVGVFMSSDGPPFVIVENKKTKQQDAFTVGENMFGEAKLVAIDRTGIVIERAGEKERINLEDVTAAGGRTVQGIERVTATEFLISREELDKELNNMPLLLSQARAVPFFRDGKPAGIRLFAIKPDSFYWKIGLRNGDVLISINGEKLDDMSQALEIFNRLKNERSFKVELERFTKKIEYSYEIR